MSRLIVKCDDRILNEYSVGSMATIGRHSDNTIVLDDPAVSGHHACVFRDGDDEVLKDLQSTNGTFINEKRVSHYRLRKDDVIRIGKHSLVFERTIGGAPAREASSNPWMSNPSDTVFLDAGKHQALLAMLRDADQDGAMAADSQTAMARAAVLRVVSGEPAQTEYPLEAATSIIGRSDRALLRLDGWFTPKIAVAIARSSEGYVATAMRGRTRINHKPLKGRWKLQHGDVLEVKGLTLEFRLVD
jgi:pSer/pThr/pTyr-binding forkhead associated (FHA) protein